MDDGEVTVKLDRGEWKLISALRDVPASPLRDLMQAMIAELTEYVKEPGCAEMQADGVPCASPSADCEQCQKVRSLLESLRRRAHE
jgi:hypothetical protein